MKKETSVNQTHDAKPRKTIDKSTDLQVVSDLTWINNNDDKDYVEFHDGKDISVIVTQPKSDSEQKTAISKCNICQQTFPSIFSAVDHYVLNHTTNGISNHETVPSIMKSEETEYGQ